MAINALLDIELSVPEPDALFEFWIRRGLVRTDDGTLGTADRPVQLRVAPGTHRHLSELHLGCEAEADLATIAARLDLLGIDSTIVGTRLSCVDPVLGHRVVIDVGGAPALTPTARRASNGPGALGRPDDRADAVAELAPRAPRRLGHVVFGTPDVPRTTAFYLDGLGYRVSDQILDGLATFARVESDHHNLLIAPGPTGHLNHYAFEVDDIDAIGKAGTAVVAERADASVVGIGRHHLGSNLFWYLTDPSGTMFEFFCDMDQIVDDDVWDKDHCKRDWEGSDGPSGFSVWGPTDPPPGFFDQPDLAVIAAARAELGLV